MNMRQHVIEELHCEIHVHKRDGKKWGRDWAKVCERAGYRCEYCGKDMLASLDDYLSMETEHIVPRSAGGCDTVGNSALSCPVCHGKKLKNDWNPAEYAGEGAGRKELIQAVRKYLIGKRVDKYEEFLKYRQIVGYPFSHQEGSCCE